MAQQHEVKVEHLGNGLEQVVTTGAHRLLVDEPVEVGGRDRGPTPYDLLVAALGSCTAMTLKLYAQRKQWPLEGVRVRLVHERVHASDCLGCEDGRHFLDRVEREIELVGPLTDEQRQRLIEIADKCPVHRTLEGGVKIVTRMTPTDSGTSPPRG